MYEYIALANNSTQITIVPTKKIEDSGLSAGFSMGLIRWEK